MELVVKIDLTNPTSALEVWEEVGNLLRSIPRKNSKPQTTSSSDEFELGTRAAELFKSITSIVALKGETTLEEVAALPEWNCTPASLRGTMMNAMRTLNRSKREAPFESKWSPERRCVVYTRKYFTLLHGDME
jgi:hypothetical protein